MNRVAVNRTIELVSIELPGDILTLLFYTQPTVDGRPVKIRCHQPVTVKRFSRIRHIGRLRSHYHVKKGRPKRFLPHNSVSLSDLERQIQHLQSSFIWP